MVDLASRDRFRDESGQIHPGRVLGKPWRKVGCALNHRVAGQIGTYIAHVPKAEIAGVPHGELDGQGVLLGLVESEEHPGQPEPLFGPSEDRPAAPPVRRFEAVGESLILIY